MNPVTRALLNELADAGAERFVQDWDELEKLVIEIYKEASASPEHENAYRHLSARLHVSYPPIREALAIHWRAAMIRGRAIEADPYALLMGQKAAAEFVGNWEAMQTLPAAREALNEMLVAKIEERGT
jgi:hypothetical protein